MLLSAFDSVKCLKKRLIELVKLYNVQKVIKDSFSSLFDKLFEYNRAFKITFMVSYKPLPKYIQSIIEQKSNFDSFRMSFLVPISRPSVPRLVY